MRVMGWDIGGANCKAYCLDWQEEAQVEVGVQSQPLAVWKEPDRLPHLLAEMARPFQPVDLHAVTMTAELCDVFPSKQEGVRCVLDAVRFALPGNAVWVWTTEGRFRPLGQVHDAPALGAAANWLATATLLARHCPTALLIDVGSTTTDLIPIEGRRVVATGRDDPGRLASGELVYTGMVRTPVCAVAPEVYLCGQAVRLCAELFAVTGDAYTVLGLLDPADYPLPTPDGRPVAAGAAAQRLARMLGADSADLGDGAVRWLARQVMDAQVSAISRGAMQVLSRMQTPWAVDVVGTGLGAALARAVADRLGLTCSSLAAFGLASGQVAPAGAVARLLAEEVLSWPLFAS
jgi:(4-(4-[2-(gamma-L-glutamylamino)ethyl]phenoxymethyl)furan-2-yl)methanamine synthase